MHSNQRKSTIQLGEVYFWTATIHHWKHLLKPNKYKQIIIDSLQNLVARNLITVYGYVIMPNHLHLIWEMNEKNGKELPSASFLKWIAH
jgi:putative transposase